MHSTTPKSLCLQYITDVQNQRFSNFWHDPCVVRTKCQEMGPKRSVTGFSGSILPPFSGTAALFSGTQPPFWEISMRTTNSRPTTVLPLGIKNRVKTELPALVALTAIGEPWFSPEHQSDLLAVALVVSELAPPCSVQAQCSTELQRLCADTITMANKVEIALNLAECLPWLQTQPNLRIQRALTAVLSRCFRLAA